MTRQPSEPDEGDREDAQLGAMRSVWRSMREENPPDGGMVDLLAAARQKAAALRARPTLRQRLLAVIRRPPALAFAAVMVLIGGAALVLGRGSTSSSQLAARSSSGLREPGLPVERQPLRDDRSTVRAATTSEASVPRDRAPAPPASPQAGARAQLDQLDQLYRQCSSAARRGDCAAVRRMLEALAKTDHGERARIVRDAAVAKCLAE